MAFPQTPLDVRTELQIAGAWTDITGDVYTRSPITIERGAKDEGNGVDPSRCSLTLNNRDGKYSPRNPMSPYYGLIGRNTPIRVSVQGPESYLALDGTSASTASTPGTAALDITGDIDIRVEATADWYAAGTQVLIGKWNSAAAQRSWMLALADGALQLWFSPTGTGSLFAGLALPTLPARAALRATLDVDNGAGGWTARLYWATGLDGPWTQLGSDLMATGTTSIFASTAPLLLAPSTTTIVPNWLPINGRIHRAEVRSGINGTAVAAPDVRTQVPGTTGFTDAAGRAWTITGAAEISNRQYRFTGEVSSWPTRWDVSGRDVWVPIEAGGVLRRMGQGKKELDSTLRRRIPSDRNLIAYWPMEDDQGTFAAYSPLPGVSPLATTGFDFAAEDTLGGSAPLPKLKNPATLSARVPRTTAAGWQVEFVYNLPAMPATQTEILRVKVTGSAMTTAVVYASTGGIRVEARDDDDIVLAFVLFTNAAALAAFTGVWNRLAIYTADAGSGKTNLLARWRDVSSDVYYYAYTQVTATMGRVSSITGGWGAATEGMALGHLAVFNVPAASASPTAPPGSLVFSGADNGFNGETALSRMARLANEESGQVNLTWLDGDASASSERMGPQRPATLLDLLMEAEDTDGGILYERLDRAALVYRDRASLYNQPVRLALNYTAKGEVPPPLEPAEDDQRIRNDVTVSRSGGSSGRVVETVGPLSVAPPPVGVGLYDESVTLSLYDDGQPEQIAAWRVHLGTVDEARYPAITVWLHAAPHLIKDVLALDIGDRITISTPPAWLPPGLIDQHMRGYTEVLDLYTWSLTMNGTPASPWEVGVVEDPILGRADTDGSTVSGDFSATAALIRVATPIGPVWTQDLAELPFDVQAGGEVMTVTDIIGVRGDRFDRSVVDGWGTATSGQAWTITGGAASDYAVQGG
ncbi:hypothetical protein [Streptomyces sp. NPDC058092]|uniref:hypothetical protein n=1 Tax=Streptomyces sp. NPDC058092 TaxID=3346336 RepID=UPI0036E1D01D